MARSTRDFDEISFREIVAMIKRSWRMLALACVFATLGTWLQFLKQPMYSAKSFINLQKTESSPLQAMTARFSGVNPYMIDDSKKLKPYLEYIYSSQLKERLAQTILADKRYDVVDDLDMSPISVRARVHRMTGWEWIEPAQKNLYNKDAIAFLLAGKISANAGNQDTVGITVRSRSPQASIYLANLILDYTKDAILSRDLRELDGAKAFIESQLGEVESKISKIQASIVGLKKNYSKLTNTSDAQDTVGALGKIKFEVTEAKAQLVQTRELISQLQKKKGADYISVNRLQRLQREETFIKSRLNSLRSVQKDLLSTKERLPDFEQTIQHLVREQEFQYMYSGELKKQLLQIDVQRISFQNKVRNVTRAGSQTVYKRSAPLKKAAVGCLFACLVILAVSFVRDYLTPLVRGKKDLADMGFHFLGNIPNLSVTNVERIISSHIHQDARPGIVEPLIESPDIPKYNESQSYIFGSIRSKIIHYMDHLRKPMKVVAVASPRQGDGKTLVAARLAQVFSQISRKVLLLDADMMKADLSRFFAQTSQPGLAQLLESGGSPDAFVQSVPECSRLDILPAGYSQIPKSDLILNGRFADLMNHLKEQYDLIIIDTPATLLAQDSIVPMRHADLVLLSVSDNLTHMDDVEKMKEEMEVLDGCEIGFVLNRSGSIDEYYYYSTGTPTKRGLKNTG